MRTSLTQRLITLVLLAAYAITATSVLPAVVALAAAIDGSHSVQITQSAQFTRLTLHHRESSFTPSVTDHDGRLARTLVSLCSTTSSGDHQLSCAQFNSSTKNQRETAAKPSTPTPTTLVLQSRLKADRPDTNTAVLGRFQTATVAESGIRRIIATVRLLI